MGLQFQPGAMPQLQRLRLRFERLQTKFIQYLSHLVALHATLICGRATPMMEVEAAEAAIKDLANLGSLVNDLFFFGNFC